MLTQQHLVTVAEYETFIALPEHRDRRFELIEGVIVEKMPTIKHGLITAIFVAQIYNFLQLHSIGIVVVEMRIRPTDDSHNDRIPDISFIREDRLNRPLPDRSPLLIMPDLVIEVQSPDDTPKEMLEKAQYYLANGTQMVVLVYTEKRVLEVQTATYRQILTEADTFDGGEVLPGFSVKVATLFEGL